MQYVKLVIVEIVENHVINENVHEGADCHEDEKDPQSSDHRHIIHFVGEHKQPADEKHEVGHYCRENVELPQSHHTEEHNE